MATVVRRDESNECATKYINAWTTYSEVSPNKSLMKGLILMIIRALNVPTLSASASLSIASLLLFEM